MTHSESSRTARATQRNPISEKQNIQKKKKEEEEKEEEEETEKRKRNEK